jgi:hypothetical protein
MGSIIIPSAGGGVPDNQCIPHPEGGSRGLTVNVLVRDTFSGSYFRVHRAFTADRMAVWQQSGGAATDVTIGVYQISGGIAGPTFSLIDYFNWSYVSTNATKELTPNGGSISLEAGLIVVIQACDDNNFARTLGWQNGLDRPFNIAPPPDSFPTNFQTTIPYAAVPPSTLAVSAMAGSSVYQTLQHRYLTAVP